MDPVLCFFSFGPENAKKKVKLKIEMQCNTCCTGGAIL